MEDDDGLLLNLSADGPAPGPGSKQQLRVEKWRAKRAQKVRGIALQRPCMRGHALGSSSSASSPLPFMCGPPRRSSSTGGAARRGSSSRGGPANRQRPRLQQAAPSSKATR